MTILNTLFNMFLDFMLIIFSYIVPKQKNLILFGAHLGKKYNGNTRYLIEYLSKNKDSSFEYYWITKNKSVKNKIETLNIPVLYQYTFKTYWKILRAKYLIIDFIPKDIIPFGETTLGNFYYINTWHGSFIKKIGKPALEFGRSLAHLKYLGINLRLQILFKKLTYDHLIHFNEFLVASEFVGSNLKECFRCDKIIVKGYPRNDALFNKVTNDLYAYFKLNDYNDIYLYAPTYRDYDTMKIPFSDEGLKEINDYLINMKSIMLIKIHPLEKKFFNLDKYSNIHRIPDSFGDIYDIMKFTTCLITDYSGTYFDFLLKDQPTIFYRYDYDEYIEKCRDIFYNIDELIPGPVAKKENELLELMKTKKEWFSDPDYQNRHKKVKNTFNQFTEGNFCESFIAYLKSKIA